MDTETGKRVRKQVGANIRAERARRGLTQQEAADRSGMVIAQYARIERGETNSALTLYAQIARGIGVPLSLLMEQVDLTPVAGE